MKKIHSGSFLSAHFRRILLRLVLKSTKMEKSMSDDSQKLFIKSHLKNAGILAHPFHTDVNITIEASALHIVECNYIRESVVLEVLKIELEQIVIIAENVIHIAQLFAMRLGQFGKPSLVHHLMGELECGLGMEKYHIQKFWQKYRKKRKWGG